MTKRLAEIVESLKRINGLLAFNTYYSHMTKAEHIEEFKRLFNKKYPTFIPVEIGNYGTVLEWTWPYDDNLGKDGNAYYSKMHNSVFEKVSELLSKAGLEEHVLNVSSILQIHICRKILAEISEYDNKKNKSFEKELYCLYQAIQNDVLDIKIAANRKDDIVFLKNKNLIEIIKILLKDVLFELTTTKVIAQDYSGTDQNFEDNSIQMSVYQSAALNILVYIQLYTKFKYNVTKDKAFQKHFTNKQYKIVGELILAAGIVSDTYIESDIPKIARNWILRALEKGGHAYLFDPEQQEQELKKILADPIFSDEELRKMLEDITSNRLF
ncbi:MAG: hypothetical protein DI598_00635 [Pseudopedobacter saltans]|uniref:Uncharacterized protein n=1 Tax=Pseudopedobacter saltans TaxID=151895 RepID=A0A2W5HAD0_9SPHI|nr:MAG: hypothetical protein DI598_00635 [Pseudopedobacter saltans]